MNEHLFVYGTLAPGRENAHIMAGVHGTWRTGYVRGTLIPEGWGAARGYPGLVVHADGDVVRGLVFTSSELYAHWARVDEFEGEGYVRIMVTGYLGNGHPVQVYVYALSRWPEDLSGYAAGRRFRLRRGCR